MMEYKGYFGKVEVDAEAKILHGEVIGIRDVVTFQGTSVGATEKAFRESVDDYLAFCKERGEDPESPFSGRFVLRIDANLHRSLNMLAQASGQSLNTLVTEYLSKVVKENLPEAVSRATSQQPRTSANKKAGTRATRGSHRSHRSHLAVG